MSELLREVEEEQEEQEEQEDHFIVDSDDKAEWCLSRIREAEEKLSKWKKHYADQLASIEKKTQATIDRMNYYLEQYFNTVPHKKAKTQESYLLPSGKLVMKQQEPEYEHNDDELVPWLKSNHPELVKVKESSDWAGLKKQLIVFAGSVTDENGEVVPGVTATPRPNIFKAEVK